MSVTTTPTEVKAPFDTAGFIKTYAIIGILAIFGGIAANGQNIANPAYKRCADTCGIWDISLCVNPNTVVAEIRPIILGFG